jgi:hypothetical protein
MLHAISNLLSRFAATCPTGDDGAASLFGFPTWYQYLDGDIDPVTKNCNLVINEFSDLAAVGFAIVEIMIRIAGMAAVGYVIYGGIRMTMSSGEPDKFKAARQAVINGVVGLIIAITATAVVSYIASQFTGA